MLNSVILDKSQEYHVRRIVKAISNAVGALEDQGLGCWLNIEWTAPRTARVRCKVSSCGVGLLDADSCDMDGLEEILSGLYRLDWSGDVAIAYQ